MVRFRETVSQRAPDRAGLCACNVVALLLLVATTLCCTILAAAASLTVVCTTRLVVMLEKVAIKCTLSATYVAGTGHFDDREREFIFWMMP